MNLSKTIAFLSIALLTRGAAEEGFVPIFNGKDLSGWEVLQGTADYSVVDGSIVGTTAAGSPNSFLCSKKHYFDFELRFEVKLDNDELNSGCQIRSNTSVDYRSGLVHGYQVEIEPAGTAGFIYDEGRRGWLSHERTDPSKNAAFKRGEWNSYRVLCQGDTIKTWVNGVLVADLVDGQTHSGFIGLQVHSVPGDPKWKVRWKNIRIREIPIEMEELIDGKSLENIVTTGNWLPQGDGSVLLVPRSGESGWARWSSYLWAKKRYGNFLCSFDFKYQKGGNSGFYFHVGDKNNPVNTGIEIQINDVHGWPEPISHHELGGVLLTRGPAKNMAKPAAEWNTMVVSCEGGHLKVWVNDLLVQNMFLDQTVIKGRPAKGYLGFQDHGLPFELRHIRIKEGAEILEPASLGKEVTVSGEWVGRERELSKTHVTDDNFGSIWAAPEGSRDGWVEIDLGEEKRVMRALLDDTPYLRTRKFALQAKVGERWEFITGGTTIGARKQLVFEPIQARYFRLQIQEAVDVPTIAEFQLFEDIPQPAWGKLSRVAESPGIYSSELPPNDAERALSLPVPFPHIVRAKVGNAPVQTEFNQDASQISLVIPSGVGGQLKLEIAEHTVRHRDGRIAYSAKDAKVIGSTAALESHPGNYRIGFWSNLADTVRWDQITDAQGGYNVALTYSLGEGSSVVEIAMGGETLEVELPATGSWYRYATVKVGVLNIGGAGGDPLTVTPKSKTGGWVMNLKAVLLEPVSGGEGS